MEIRKPLSASDAAKAAKPKLMRGWFRAEFLEAVEKDSRRGNPMIEVLLAVYDGEGATREYRDWLTTSERGAEKLRHACEAVAALAKYDAGEISQDDFPGHACQVRLDIEKKRGFPDRSVIIDYKPASASGVVNLRAG
jgi:hypothetical protein